LLCHKISRQAIGPYPYPYRQEPGFRLGLLRCQVVYFVVNLPSRTRQHRTVSHPTPTALYPLTWPFYRSHNGKFHTLSQRAGKWFGPRTVVSRFF